MTQIIIDSLFIIIFSAYLYWLYGLLRALNSDAPYVPMSIVIVNKLVAMAQAQPEDLWVDLGSGDGRVLIEACRRYGVRGVGIERVGVLRWYARLRILMAGYGGKIHIRRGDFFKTNLSEARVVSFYLMPDTSEKLILKLRKELRPGVKIVFHRFPIVGLPLTAKDDNAKLYLATAPFV